MNPFKDEFKIIKEFIRSHIFLLSTLCFIAYVCLGFLLPVYFVRNGYFHHVFWDTGQLGDTIGGIISPFIAIGAAFLTFIAFWVQYQANQKQMALILDEKKTSNFNTELNIAFDCLKNLRANINSEILSTNSGRHSIINEIDSLSKWYLNKYNYSYKDDLFPKDIFNVQINYFLNTLNYIKSLSDSFIRNGTRKEYIISSSHDRSSFYYKIETKHDTIKEQYDFLIEESD